MSNSVIFLTVLFIAFQACKNVPQSEKNKSVGTSEMEDLNTYFVKKDRERIQNYINRRNLKMTESPTGLWYQVNKEGAGEFFRDNDRVKFDYECTLLDGTKCYSSGELGPKEIILGRTELEAGLYEGFRMLKPGAEAVFILPPWLAYGFVGDRNKIPPRAVIVYYVSILAQE